MATLATDPIPENPVPARIGPRAERRFYMSMVIVLMLVVLAGFSHGFYLRPWVHFPAPKPDLSPFVMLHGLVYTSWMLLLLVQVSLVSAGRRDLHRMIGMGGFALAALLVPIAYLVGVWQVARHSGPPIASPLDWSVVPLSQVPVMVIVLWLGWKTRRRDLQAHKRLMLGYTLLLLEPAVGRLPLGPPTVEANAVAGVLALLPFLVLFAWDWYSRGRLHWASIVAASLASGAAVFRNWFLFHPGEWERIAPYFPGVGA